MTMKDPHTAVLSDPRQLQSLGFSPVLPMFLLKTSVRTGRISGGLACLSSHPFPTASSGLLPDGVLSSDSLCVHHCSQRAWMGGGRSHHPVQPLPPMEPRPLQSPRPRHPQGQGGPSASGAAPPRHQRQVVSQEAQNQLDLGMVQMIAELPLQRVPWQCTSQRPGQHLACPHCQHMQRPVCSCFSSNPMLASGRSPHPPQLAIGSRPDVAPRGAHPLTRLRSSESEESDATQLELPTGRRSHGASQLWTQRQIIDRYMNELIITSDR